MNKKIKSILLVVLVLLILFNCSVISYATDIYRISIPNNTSSVITSTLYNKLDGPIKWNFTIFGTTFKDACSSGSFTSDVDPVLTADGIYNVTCDTSGGFYYGGNSYSYSTGDSFYVENGSGNNTFNITSGLFTITYNFDRYYPTWSSLYKEISSDSYNLDWYDGTYSITETNYNDLKNATPFSYYNGNKKYISLGRHQDPNNSLLYFSSFRYSVFQCWSGTGIFTIGGNNYNLGEHEFIDINLSSPSTGTNNQNLSSVVMVR